MMLAGFTIEMKEPGTVIHDPRSGKSMTVQDDNAVRLGRAFYVSPNTYQALKDRSADRG